MPIRPENKSINRPVAVLFACKDSIYKTFSGIELYDAERNAKTFPGHMPVVAHPPCGSWGRLRRFARPVPGEHELSIWAVEQVQKWGGVLEHPSYSLLWQHMNLPKPGDPGNGCGWSLSVPQFWWGHQANKSTWLYVCGLERRSCPDIPFRLGEAMYVIGGSKSRRPRPTLSKSKRERTPFEFAQWLIELARRCFVG